MTIRALSFDVDGCLFNRAYLQTRDVILANKPLLDQIKQDNKAFDKVYTFVGSSRQSVRIDRVNSAKRGSCFPALYLVNKHLGSTLNTLLLADIYQQLPLGTSYKRAMDPHYAGPHADWIFDETKATIIYAQVHHLAHQHPGDEIILDFYDDRGRKKCGRDDILEHLYSFYKKYPVLIPDNVTLRLHCYAGQETTKIAEIKGVGFIDREYRQTIKEMAARSELQGSKIDVARTVDAAALISRKPQTIVSPTISPVSIYLALENNSIPMNELTSFSKANRSVEMKRAYARFTIALRAIKNKANELDQKANYFFDHQRGQRSQDARYYCYKDAANAAKTLHRKLKNASLKHVDPSTFKIVADQAILEARESTLKEHRGYAKEILGYAGLAVLAFLTIVTAGVAYAIAGGIQYAVNRQFFFSTTIKTDSINRVDQLAAEVDQMTSFTR